MTLAFEQKPQPGEFPTLDELKAKLHPDPEVLADWEALGYGTAVTREQEATVHDLETIRAKRAGKLALDPPVASGHQEFLELAERQTPRFS